MGISHFCFRGKECVPESRKYMNILGTSFAQSCGLIK